MRQRARGDGQATGTRGAPILRRTLVGTLVALLSLLAPAPATALEQVRIGLMSLEAPAGFGGELEALAAESERIVPRLESDLGVRAASRFRVVLIPPGAALSDTGLRRLDAGAPAWAAGYTVPALRVCVIRMALAGRYPYGSLESVLAHEVCHLLLHDTVGDRLPLWFEEGVATWEGRKWEFRDALVYSSSLLTSDLPKLAELDSSFHGSAAEAQLAYAGAHAFVASTIHARGGAVLRELLRASRDQPFDRAWRSVTGTSLERAETDWRRMSLIRYRWLPLLGTSSTLWIGITLLSLVAGVRKRALVRRERERWAREEAESEAPPEVEPEVEDS